MRAALAMLAVSLPSPREPAPSRGESAASIPVTPSGPSPVRLATDAPASISAAHGNAPAPGQGQDRDDAQTPQWGELPHSVADCYEADWLDSSRYLRAFAGAVRLAKDGATIDLDVQLARQDRYDRGYTDANGVKHPPHPFDHIWFWVKRPTTGPRKGQRCRVLIRGGKNSVLVEFEDGYRVITSRHAVRLA